MADPRALRRYGATWSESGSFLGRLDALAWQPKMSLCFRRTEGVPPPERAAP